MFLSPEQQRQESKTCGFPPRLFLILIPEQQAISKEVENPKQRILFSTLLSGTIQRQKIPGLLSPTQTSKVPAHQTTTTPFPISALAG